MSWQKPLQDTHDGLAVEFSGPGASLRDQAMLPYEHGICFRGNLHPLAGRYTRRPAGLKGARAIRTAGLLLLALSAFQGCKNNNVQSGEPEGEVIGLLGKQDFGEIGTAYFEVVSDTYGGTPLMMIMVDMPMTCEETTQWMDDGGYLPTGNAGLVFTIGVWNGETLVPPTNPAEYVLMPSDKPPANTPVSFIMGLMAGTTDEATDDLVFSSTAGSVTLDAVNDEVIEGSFDMTFAELYGTFTNQVLTGTFRAIQCPGLN